MTTEQDRETATLRAAARRALAASPRWKEATDTLPRASIDRIGPVDLDACSHEELDNIAAWATNVTDVMPAHLVAYLGAVREATR